MLGPIIWIAIIGLAAWLIYDNTQKKALAETQKSKPAKSRTSKRHKK